MSKIYLDQPLRIEADCVTDISTGTPTLAMKLINPNAVETNPTATLLSGSTTVCYVDMIANVVGVWKYQPVVTDAAYPSNPYLGETQCFEVFAEGA